MFQRVHVGFVTFDKPQFVASAGQEHDDAGGAGSEQHTSQKGAIVALLRHNSSGRHVVVCSVHLDVPINAQTGEFATGQQVVSVRQMVKKIKARPPPPEQCHSFVIPEQ